MAKDLINRLQEVTGIKDNPLATEANGIYHDLVVRTEDDDGTARRGPGMYGSLTVMYQETAGIITDVASSVLEVETALADTIVAKDKSEAALVAFELNYLGAHSANPIEDNNGGILADGAFYYNTTTTPKELRIWDGEAFVTAVFDATGAVLQFNGRDGAVSLNASDIESVLGYSIFDIVTDSNYVHTDNNYTDAQLAIVADNAEAVAAIKQIHFDSNEPTGFIREQIGTVGILEATTDGTNIHHIGAKGQGEYKHSSDGVFYNGDVATNTVDYNTHFAARLTPKVLDEDAYGRGELIYYIEGTKHVRTEVLEIAVPKETGMHFLYMSTEGVLSTSQILHHDMFDGDTPHYFEDTPIVSVLYYSEGQDKLSIFADERHGITMDGYTHQFWHTLFGTQYSGGMDLSVGLGATQHGLISSGSLYDEDLYMPLPAQFEAPVWYNEGIEWKAEAGHGTANLFYKPASATHIVYNPFNVDDNTFSLVELAEGEFTLMFFIGTNNAIAPYIKIIGQQVYSDIVDGRESIETEVKLAKTRGLPTPEFLFIGAILVNHLGEAQDLTDGGAYLDLRFAKVSGSSVSSAAVVVAADVTYSNYNSTIDALTVKGALDELDSRALKDFRYKGPVTITDTDIELRDMSPTFKVGDTYRLKTDGTNKLLVNGIEYPILDDTMFMVTEIRDNTTLEVADLIITYAPVPPEVLIDSMFASSGFMITDGAGNYSVDESVYLTEHQDITGKVDIVAGKDLSDNNLTDDIVTVITDNETARHTHSNATSIDKFGEDVDGNPTYNGTKIDTTVAQRDVYDGLDSEDNTISLSAKQGKILQDSKLPNTATTADVEASTDRNYVTDADVSTIAATSNTNTGDQTGVTTLLDTYSKPTSTGDIGATDSLQAAIGKLERGLEDATAGGGDANVQVDWDEADVGSDAFIQNKPDLGSGGDVNVQADWSEADSASDAYILNKPAVGTGDMEKTTYDATGSGVVDNAEKVNNLTVETSVPVGAVFVDTVYDDTLVTEHTTAITDLQTNLDGKLAQDDTLERLDKVISRQDIVTMSYAGGSGSDKLSSIDYTNNYDEVFSYDAEDRLEFIDHQIGGVNQTYSTLVYNTTSGKLETVSYTATAR